MMEIHSYTFGSSRDETKVFGLAKLVSTKSKEALQKSIPEYLKEIKEELEIARKEAIETNSEALAPESFEFAKLLAIDGEDLVNANQIDKTDKAIEKFKEAINLFEKARELSLSQKEAIIDSNKDLELDLDQIDTFVPNSKTKTNKLREEYKIAESNLSEGKLKLGMNQVERIRTEISKLAKESLLPFAKDKAKLALETIQNAEKKMNSRDFPILAEASDYLSSSKEAYSVSVDLITKEQYYDSIKHSEESIEFAKKILEESSNTLTKRESSKESQKEEVKEIKNLSTPKNKYIVKKTNPPETLWRIAQKKEIFGNKNSWIKIYEANKKSIKNPNLIYPNQILLIPNKD